MILRLAALPDCEALAHLQVDSYRSAYRGIYPESYLAQFSYQEQTQDWRDWMTFHPQDILLISENESGELKGYALARCAVAKISPYDGEVLAIHVKAPFQRQGIGRALFVESARRLHAMGTRSLLVWVLEQNQPARAFYERMGGFWIGRQEVDLGEEDVQPFEIAYGWLAVANLWA